MTIAVYAGTFDPVTAGHLSVVRAAAGLFEHLVVVVAVNPEKTTLFTGEERMALLREAVAAHPNVRVASTSGYVVELARAGADLSAHCTPAVAAALQARVATEKVNR